MEMTVLVQQMRGARAAWLGVVLLLWILLVVGGILQGTH
jgi:hypothetical protein